ncbi:MAG: alpha/beta hydrolase [Verrucomicrobia bacterium]|nr:alpha/beta hydrolase [Verrucomicrobiota bacterium]
MQKTFPTAALAVLLVVPAFAGEVQSFKIWPGPPPGDENLKLPPEGDTTKADGRLVGGKSVIRLGNVATPMLEVFPAPKDKATGAACVVCPGGGFSILAYDLEGTEVAEWLNSIGVTAFVLKYRVPARDKDKRWLAAVQDAQRAMSLVRRRAAEWAVDPKRIGICGFSAGGASAGLTALLFDQRQYAPLDDADKVSSRPDFAMLIYAAYFVDRGSTTLRDDIKVPKNAPPMFFAHAFDDGVPVFNPLLLAAEMKKVGVPAEVHVYPAGGHGYGLRRTEMPVTTWPDRAADWLRVSGWLKKL